MERGTIDRLAYQAIPGNHCGAPRSGSLIVQDQTWWLNYVYPVEYSAKRPAYQDCICSLPLYPALLPPEGYGVRDGDYIAMEVLRNISGGIRRALANIRRPSARSMIVSVLHGTQPECSSRVVDISSHHAIRCRPEYICESHRCLQYLRRPMSISCKPYHHWITALAI